MKNTYSFLSLIVIGLFLMGCPNNNNKNSNIPEIGSYDDRSQVAFVGSSFSQPYVERINMPYAFAVTSSDAFGQLKMFLFLYEYDVSASANPCLNLRNNLLHNQTYQRSFIINNVDFNSRQPQVINPRGPGNSGYFNSNYPSVNFQMTDRTRNMSMLESSFYGQVTVLETTFEGALIRFDQVNSNESCNRTPENQMYTCGARLSGQVRVAFCRL